MNSLSRFILRHHSEILNSRRYESQEEALDPDFPPERVTLMEGQIELWILLRTREIVLLSTIAMQTAESTLLDIPMAWNVLDRPSDIIKMKKETKSISPLEFSLEYAGSVKMIADR